MDANKREKLVQIGYKVRRTCGNCQHGAIPTGKTWGTCKVESYEHKKHSDTTRELSIHGFGHCDQHEYKDGTWLDLGRFAEFAEDGAKLK
jgi:hypothetical protein